MGVVLDFQREAARVRSQRAARGDLIVGPLGLFDLACLQWGIAAGLVVAAWSAWGRR